MSNEKDIKTKKIEVAAPAVVHTGQHVEAGLPIPKTIRVQSFSPAEWEEFTQEWASSLKSEYSEVARFAGSGDQGIDVIGYLTDGTFAGGWDNYQCKHYDKALAPSQIWVEIGKVIYYTYLGHYPAPRKYYFVAPHGVGTALSKLLALPERLKEGLRNKWDIACAEKISSTKKIALDAPLQKQIDGFDFSIFSSTSVVKMLEQHSKTPFHAVRFGGGLPTRPKPQNPPDKHGLVESRYIEQLFEAYSEYVNVQVSSETDLHGRSDLREDLHRQRERFWHAEALRNFARDTVPKGTFESLKDEVFDGVIDICNSNHPHGVGRMRSAMTHSATLSLASNPLVSVTKIKDKQGICHHLANEDRLTWVTTDGEDESK